MPPYTHPQHNGHDKQQRQNPSIHFADYLSYQLILSLAADCLTWI